MMPTYQRPTPGCHQRGLALLECLLAATILAVIVAAVAQAVNSGQMQTYQALHDLRGQNLAVALMEEVLSMPYTADGVTIGRGGRVKMADYDGLSEKAGALKDITGQLYASPFQSFSRSVSVTPATLAVGGQPAIPGLTITVTVTDAHGGQRTLQRFVPQP